LISHIISKSINPSKAPFVLPANRLGNSNLTSLAGVLAPDVTLLIAKYNHVASNWTVTSRLRREKSARSVLAFCACRVERDGAIVTDGRFGFAVPAKLTP